jgi:branched-chain amino acid transport system substrate-binding protein
MALSCGQSNPGAGPADIERVDSHGPFPYPSPVLNGEHKSGLRVLLGAFAWTLLFPSWVLAEPGVSAEQILFGQSAALNGPAASLGRDFNLGIQTAFHEVNASGGIHGRTLKLVARDDGYEPTQAIANTEKLLQEDQVFALIGEVGTPTSRAVVPLAEAANAPFLAPFTGAEFLRDAGLSVVINLRASYNQEAERGIDYLVGTLKLKRIAVLFQDDTFGRDGLEAVKLALANRGLEPVADASYRRNTTAVKRAVLDLRASQPEAVFIIGAYGPTAEFIRVSQDIGFKPRFMTLSFVGSTALAAELAGRGKGVLVTQVMPLFSDTGQPLVQRFQAALRQHDPEAKASFVALEGYAAGRLVAATLELLGKEVSRSAFLVKLRSGEVTEIDGLPLSLGPQSNQASNHVFLTELHADGSFTEIQP